MADFITVGDLVNYWEKNTIMGRNQKLMLPKIKAELHDIKAYFQNNSPVGRMITFKEGLGTALKNSLICTKDELMNPIGNVVKGISVQSSVPRVQYKSDDVVRKFETIWD